MSGWSTGFEERRTVTITAVPSTTTARRAVEGTMPWERASAPRRKLTRKAASEVIPRSAPRRTSSA